MGKGSKYKYVEHDAIGKYVGPTGMRTKSNLERIANEPWVAIPRIQIKFGGNLSQASSAKRFATEREAALFVDKWMLEHGRQPVNILKAKTTTS